MSTTSAEDLQVERVTAELPVSRRQRIVAGLVLILLGALTVQVLGGELKHGTKARLRFGSISAEHVPHLSFAAAPLVIVVGVLIVVVGAYHLAVGFSRRLFTLAVGVSLGLFLVAFLCWMSARNTFSPLDLVGLGTSTIGFAVPIILGALCGLLCERSGVINVAIEGQMLAGAWTGALVGTLVGSLAGLAAGGVAGALLGWMLAVFAIRYVVNQVVLGVVLNVFAAGLTGFFYDAFMQNHVESLNQPPLLEAINIPLLSKIPVVGPLLFQANLIVYITYVLIIVVDVALFRTRWGLRTRAVGEHPKAADTVGIKVLATRYRNVIIGGAIAGIAGTYFIFQVGAFAKNITSGYGFIALAAVIFGRWSPRGAVAAALLFGFANAIQTNLSISAPSIPSNFIAMLPYLATIVAVAGLVGRVRAPAADGEPYVKG